MSYAAETEVPVEKSRAEIERILTKYGADRFMVGSDQARAMLAFQVRGKMIQFTLPLPDRQDKRFWYTPARRNKGDHLLPQLEQATLAGRMPKLLLTAGGES